MDDPSVEGEPGWQWWRISYSNNDANVISTTASSSNSPARGPASGYELDSMGVPIVPTDDWENEARQKNDREADCVGFTVQKVREVEVLKAARDESTSALLVYASESAVNCDFIELPPQLKVRLRKANHSFSFASVSLNHVLHRISSAPITSPLPPNLEAPTRCVSHRRRNEKRKMRMRMRTRTEKRMHGGADSLLNHPRAQTRRRPALRLRIPFYRATFLPCLRLVTRP